MFISYSYGQSQFMFSILMADIIINYHFFFFVILLADPSYYRIWVTAFFWNSRIIKTTLSCNIISIRNTLKSLDTLEKATGEWKGGKLYIAHNPFNRSSRLGVVAVLSTKPGAFVLKNFFHSVFSPLTLFPDLQTVFFFLVNMAGTKKLKK